MAPAAVMRERQKSGTPDFSAEAQIELLLRVVLAKLEQHDREFADIKQMLGRGRGARDAADAALLLAIAAIGDRVMTCKALWKYRAANEAIRDALTNADIDNRRQLGKLFARLEGHVINGLQVECVDRKHRDGVRWRVRVVGV